MPDNHTGLRDFQLALPKSLALQAVLIFLAALAIRLGYYGLMELANAAHEGDFANAVCRWDCGWYMGVVRNGYNLAPHGGANGAEANWAFFPLYPLLVRWADAILPGGPIAAGAFLSMVFHALASPVLYAGYRSQVGNGNALFLAFAVALTPFALYATVPYTEGLFGLLVAICFSAALHKRWLVAAIAAALLSATRTTGVFIVIPFAIIALQTYDWRSFLTQVEPLKAVLAIAIAPLGAFIYMLFLYHHMGDALAFKSVQVAWNRGSGNPYDILQAGLDLPVTSKEFYWAICAYSGIILSLILLLKQRMAEAAFFLIIILLPLGTGLFSLDRYTFTTFLPYLALAVMPVVGRQWWFRSGLVIAMLGGWYFYIQGWVEQAAWTI